MPYIGNPPAERFTSFDYQDLTGGSGTSFTLDNTVGNPQEIEVFVNNVRQEPGVAYTVSGTALTMTGSVASTDDFYVVFQGKAIQTATHPSDRALTATDGTFTGDLTVDTNTLHVDAANNRVGVGSTSPSTLMHVSGSSVVTKFESSDNQFVTELNYNNSTSRAFIGTFGNNLVFAPSNATVGMRLTSDGLCFGSDTAAEDALNDYEQGVVNTISDNSGAGLTITRNHARYRKVGEIVNFELDISFPVTSDTSSNSITCLPFNAAVYGNADIGYSTYGSLTALAISSSKNIVFYNPGGSQLTNANLSNKRLILSITYQTSD